MCLCATIINENITIKFMMEIFCSEKKFQCKPLNCINALNTAYITKVVLSKEKRHHNMVTLSPGNAKRLFEVFIDLSNTEYYTPSKSAL